MTAPSVHTYQAKVDELSISFEDYTPDARAKYDGTHVFVGIHLPIEAARALTCSTLLTVTLPNAT